METIALLIPDKYWTGMKACFANLTSNGSMTWNDTTFILNPESGKFDALVVYQSNLPLDREFKLTFPPQRSLLNVLEPPDILKLPQRYCDQFGAVLTQDQSVKNRIASRSAHLWFLEVKVNDQTLLQIPKTKLISAIVSAKTDLRGHRKRLEWISKAKEYFGDDLDWVGRGIKDIGPRKSEFMTQYRYSIVLENGKWPHYWTEKLSDAFLANTFPFYWGAPNIEKYFNPLGLKRMNIEEPVNSFKIIKKALEEDSYTKYQKEILQNRNLIFQKYHFFNTILEHLKSLKSSAEKTLQIRPHTQFEFSFKEKLLMKVSSLNREKLFCKKEKISRSDHDQKNPNNRNMSCNKNA